MSGPVATAGYKTALRKDKTECNGPDLSILCNAGMNSYLALQNEWH